MLEVFLFVNPLGKSCRHAEAALSQLAAESPHKLRIHFVTLVNFTVIEAYMLRHQCDSKNLVLRNRLFDAAYQISLDYKAAQFQGNRKARALLIAEQAMFEEQIQYDPQFAHACLEQSGLNAASFAEDRAQAAMSMCFNSDQQVARDMGVTTAPTAVIIDSNRTDRLGFRLENAASYHLLKHVCQEIMTDPTYGAHHQRLLHAL